MRSVVVVCEDRAGLLADISYVLSKTGVCIDGIEVEVVGEKAIISLSVKDPRKAKSMLERNGYSVVEPSALVIKVSNHLRTVAEVLNMLERKRVRVEDFSEISSDSKGGIFALTVNKRRKASRILGNFIVGSSPA